MFGLFTHCFCCTVVFLLCCHRCPVGADLFSPASLTDLLHRSLPEVRDDLLYVGVRGERRVRSALCCALQQLEVSSVTFTPVHVCARSIDPLPISLDSSVLWVLSGFWSGNVDPDLLLVSPGLVFFRIKHPSSQQSHNACVMVALGRTD